MAAQFTGGFMSLSSLALCTRCTIRFRRLCHQNWCPGGNTHNSQTPGGETGAISRGGTANQPSRRCTPLFLNLDSKYPDTDSSNFVTQGPHKHKKKKQILFRKNLNTTVDYGTRRPRLTNVGCIHNKAPRWPHGGHLQPDEARLMFSTKPSAVHISFCSFHSLFLTRGTPEKKQASSHHFLMGGFRSKTPSKQKRKLFIISSAHRTARKQRQTRLDVALIEAPFPSVCRPVPRAQHSQTPPCLLIQTPTHQSMQFSFPLDSTKGEGTKDVCNRRSCFHSFLFGSLCFLSRLLR